MKKIKILTSLIGCAVLPTALAPMLTSCGCQQNINYKVTFNKSDNFIATEDKQQSGAYRWTIKAVEDYKILTENTKVTIGGKEYKGFWFVKNILYIPTKDVNGDIEITIQTKLVNGITVDADGIVKGFKQGISEKDIIDLYGDTLTIPAKAKSIAPYAFVDKTTGKSTIPSSITKLSYLIDDDGVNHLGESKTLEPYDAIGEKAFMNAPFEFMDLPCDYPYNIGESAFEGAALRRFKMPHPELIENKEEERVHLFKMKGWNGDDDFDFYNKHGIQKVGKKAFYNCKKLESVIYAPFISEVGDEAFINDDGYSSVNYIDFTLVLAEGYYSFDWQKDPTLHYKWDQFTKQWLQKKINNDYSKIFHGYNLKIVHDDPDFKKAKKGTIRTSFATHQIELGDFPAAANEYKKISKCFGCEFRIESYSNKYNMYSLVMTDTTDGNYYTNWAITSGNIIIDKNHNLESEGIFHDNDTYKFGDSEINIDLTKPEDDPDNVKRFIEIGASYQGGYLIAFTKPYPNDMKVNIKKANWTNGTPVNLEFVQIQKEETQLDWDEFAYQFYKIHYDNKPAKGSKVELTVDISSKLRDMYGNDEVITINFN